jgi:hypothetical protein
MVAERKVVGMRRMVGLIFVCLASLLAFIACGPLSAPESCGDFGGVADEVLFTEYFEFMEVVSSTTGSPGEFDDEGEMQFSSSESLSISFENKKDVSIRACMQERKGGGKILFDETKSFSPGGNSLALGNYSRGGYVIRVIVDESLVKNLPFGIK